MSKNQGGWSYFVTFPIHNIDTKFKLAITLEGSRGRRYISLAYRLIVNNDSISNLAKIAPKYLFRSSCQVELLSMAGLQNSDNKSLENRLKKFCALASLLAYVTKTNFFLQLIL